MTTPAGTLEPLDSLKTVIAEGHLLLANLSGDEDVCIEGRVEGEIAISKQLFVRPTGIVKGNVSVKHAVISGIVVGNILATECVELTKDCRVVGDIRSPRVIIADGARYRGRVAMREVEVRREWERPSPRIEAKPPLRSVPKPPPPPSRPVVVAPEIKKVASKPLPPPPPKLERLESSEGPKKKVVINVPQPQGDKEQKVAILMRAAELYREAGSNVLALQMLGQAQKLRESDDDSVLSEDRPLRHGDIE